MQDVVEIGCKTKIWQRVSRTDLLSARWVMKITSVPLFRKSEKHLKVSFWDFYRLTNSVTGLGAVELHRVQLYAGHVTRESLEFTPLRSLRDFRKPKLVNFCIFFPTRLPHLDFLGLHAFVASSNMPINIMDKLPHPKIFRNYQLKTAS